VEATEGFSTGGQPSGAEPKEPGTAKEPALANPGAKAAGSALEIAPNRRTGKTIRLVAMLLLIEIYWLISSLAGKPAGLLNATTHLPVNLTNEVDSVAVHGWRAVPIQIPYTGSLTIVAHVQRGDAMTMMLTDGNGLQKLKNHKWGSYLGEFYAPHAADFHHTGRVHQGVYYFVIRDKHVEIDSPSSSDVSVEARIEP
jgi:hypothetical protein